MNTNREQNKPWLHIWKLDSDLTTIDTRVAGQFLSEEEIILAKNFLHQEGRNRYVTAHYFLRQILSRYNELSPAEFKFLKGYNGKPYINTKEPLSFNLSYRGSQFLAGISNCSTMGVDIEKIRDVDNVSGFSECYFSEKEQEQINRQDNRQDQLSLLFKFWTMKESVIKAFGTGFTKPLWNYDLSPFFNTPVCAPDFDQQNAWTIKQINVKPGYTAAFAINTHEVEYKEFEFTEQGW
jgi:4'-phosphopantetheinyl transferase